MKEFVAGCWLLLSGCAVAQVNLIEYATKLIAEKKFAEAHRYLDSALQKNPNDVDALMMKGNAVLNADAELKKHVLIFDENHSTVFKQTAPEPVYVPSSICVELTEKYWLKCLQLDSTRVDIIKGLCTLYAMALEKEKCKALIVQLEKAERDDGEQVFRMGEYARKFRERGKFDEGMDIYQYIALLFPQNAGIRCDMASEYFYHGRHRECLQWLDSTFRFADVDETSYLNAGFNYSSLGYYDAAQKTLTDYSNRYGRAMGFYYSALRLFADSGSVTALQSFVTTTDSNAYFMEHFVANRILDYSVSKSFNAYKNLIYDAQIPNYYKVLIHQHGITFWKDSCVASAMFGVFHSMVKNYSAAVQFLDVIDEPHCDLQKKNDGYWQMHYGYALYRNKQYAETVRLLSNSTSTTAFNREAMLYFKASALYQLNKKSEAKKVWQQLADSATTKYARLAVEELRSKKF